VANAWTTIAPLAGTMPSARDWMANVAVNGTGPQIQMFGGVNASNASVGDGTTYDDRTRTWTTIPTATGLANPTRDRPTAWSANGALYVFGGFDETTNASFNTGLVYAGGWSAMPTLNAPSARARASAVWTGSDAIVWGGTPNFTSALGDGRLFRP
jgi:hypothetical protein